MSGHDAFKEAAAPILADAKLALEALTSAAIAAGIRPDAEYVREARQGQAEWRETLSREAFRPVRGEAMARANWWRR